VVMRFLPGGSLADHRRRDDDGNPLANPAGMLHFWLPAIAEALDFIHQRGMLHRDVKPGNIFFDGFWNAFLGDFGIAKVVDGTGGLAKEQTLTATMMAIGTPDYMGPELFSPKSNPDGRADQYALAVTVYEMLCGVRPFTGSKAHIVVEHTGMQVPPLQNKGLRIPESLCVAVERALAKKPAERFSTCSEFMRAALLDVAPLSPELDTTRLLCPGCKNILKLPQKAAGRTGRCPKCREPMDVAEDLGSLWLKSEERGKESATSKQSLAPLAEPLPQASAGTMWRWGMLALATCCGLALGYAGGTLSQQAKMQAELKQGESPWQDELLAAKESLAKVVEENAELEHTLATRVAELAAAEAAADVPESMVSSEIGQLEEERAEIAEPELPPVESPQAAPDTQPELSQVTVGIEAVAQPMVAPAIGMLLAGRDASRKQVLLGAAGGSDATEYAVAMALEWLKKQQSQKDGLWSLTGPYTDGGTQENQLAATAMALLAFQGAGNTRDEGPHQATVDRAWRTLLNAQRDDGAFSAGQVPLQHALYTHAQVTMALCELYGMSRDPDLAKPASMAVAYCVAAQGPNGGWRYEPGKPGDMSVTGWYMMALKSAEMAGMNVPAATFESISAFLDSVARDKGARYGYRRDSELKPASPVTAAVTAEGLLCRQYLGWPQADPRLVEGLELLMADNRLDFDNKESKDVYAWYHITQVAHHMEGDQWRRWNQQLREVLPREQVANGKQKGSWDPTLDRWGHIGGRLFVTSFCTYMLESYYRHLPLYSGLSPDVTP